MNLDISYIKKIQNLHMSSSERDSDLYEIHQLINEGFNESLDYQNNCVCNNEKREFVISKTSNSNFYKIKTRPTQQLGLGDVVNWNSYNWIVIDVNSNTQIQTSGIIQRCNLTINFQNHDNTIVSQPCIISNSYSEIESSGKVTSVPSGKTILILPYNNDTKKIYKGKRLMIDTGYDESGSQIGIVYKVTGFDSKFKDFGNGKLIYLTIESDVFNSDTDNLKYLVSDYIDCPPTPPVDPALLKCNIVGRDEIKIGTTRKYTAVFYDINGNEVSNITPNWSFTPALGFENQFSIINKNNVFEITCNNSENLIGQSINLSLDDINGLYAQKTISIKVVNMFG